jgi:hypothetical protein
MNEGNDFGARSDREVVQDHRGELQPYPEGRRERTQRLEGSQTPPRRLDSGRLRRAGRFGVCLIPSAN